LYAEFERPSVLLQPLDGEDRVAVLDAAGGATGGAGEFLDVGLTEVLGLVEFPEAFAGPTTKLPSPLGTNSRPWQMISM
jgi:hypothetical protein